jgi:hypothetical protein
MIDVAAWLSIWVVLLVNNSLSEYRLLGSIRRRIALLYQTLSEKAGKANAREQKFAACVINTYSDFVSAKFVVDTKQLAQASAPDCSDIPSPFLIGAGGVLE